MTCTRGRVVASMSFRPRPEYGLIFPTMTAGGRRGRGHRRRRPADVVQHGLTSRCERNECHARFELGSGERACFALQYSALGAAKPATRTGSEISAAIDQTVSGWQEWSELHQSYQGPWCDLVHHSGRVLQALSYQPTGAIVAAATTSLPEQVGGERNWDYRYSWVRDASMTMQALWVAACPDEAYEFFDFMASAASGSVIDRPLQIMFGIGGEHDLSERTLPHLTGWRGSTPVRVGNGAWDQPQLDVYGELLDAAAQLRDQLGVLSEPTRDFLVGLADSAAARWQQPDNGIWEVRGEPRHFVHSKVMCWVALDRAIALADLLDAASHLPVWQAAAEEIRTEVETRGWNTDLGAFTQSFDSPDLDATALLLPIVGFLPADDPRVLSSIDAVRDQLTDARGLVHRYHTRSGVDGLDGPGGHVPALHLLARPRPRAGRTDRGRHRGLRTCRWLRQRRRSARRGGRFDHRRAARQLPPGLQPHRPGQRGLGTRPGITHRCRSRRAERWTGRSTGSCFRSASRSRESRCSPGSAGQPCSSRCSSSRSPSSASPH